MAAFILGGTFLKHIKHKYLWSLLLVFAVAIVFITPSILADDTLKVGVLESDAPLSSRNKSNKMHGANVAVAQEIATDLHKEVQLVPAKSNKQLQQKLKNGTIDLALGTLFKNKRSTKNFQSSDPFLYVENILFRRSDSKKKSVKKLTDQKVGILKTGSQTQIFKQLHFKKHQYSSISQLMDAVENKQVKAAILTGPQYTAYLKKHPELVSAKDKTDKKQKQQVLKRIKDPQITAQNIQATTYHDQKLNKKVTDSLKKMTKDGRLNQISVKYFGKDITYP